MFIHFNPPFIKYILMGSCQHILNNMVKKSDTLFINRVNHNLVHDIII